MADRDTSAPLSQDIADALPALVAYVDADLRYRYVNKPYEDWFGKTRDQLLGLHVREVLGDKLYEVVGPRSLAALAGEPQQFEVQAPHSDGSLRPLEARYVPDRGEDGKVRGYYTLIVDRSDSQIRERRVVDILDGFGGGFWSVDRDWKVTYCNAVAFRFTSRTRPQFIGQPIWDLVPITGTVLEPALRRVMDTGRPEELEMESAMRPGVMLAVRAYPIEGGLAVSFRDITAAKAAQAKILESEARFRAMADSAPAPVWVTSAAGGIEFTNQAFADYAGRQPDELLDDLWLNLLHPDDMPAVLAQREIARRGPDPYAIEARFKRFDGEWRWMRATAKPRFDVHGVFQGYVGLAIDITDTRAAEARQRLLINELNHRVKNTLATVQSLAHQTLREGMITREARGLFTDRLLALSAVHNVLTRENWGGAELRAIIVEAVSPYDDPAAARIAVEGPPVRVAPNAALAISMAFNELATNATKYGALSVPQGRVTVSWTAGQDGADVGLEWRESGGPPIVAPSGKGFGSRLLTQGLAAELGAPACMDWSGDGLVCAFRAPVGGGGGD